MQENNAARPKKKLPERKCLGCGESKPKQTLARIVRAPDGAVSLDLTGAYVSRCAECLRKARRAKRIERSLEVEIPDEVYDTLEKELAENE